MRLSISQLAQRLNLNADTVRRWIRQGKMPVVREGDSGIFSQSDLVAWARRHKLSYTEPVSTGTIKKNSETFLLLPALKRGGMHKDVDADSKNDVLKRAVNLVPDISLEGETALLQQVLSREAMTSTGIGNGVAIPHPRNPLEDEIDKPVIVTLLFKKGIDYDSIDNLPVFAVFLLLSSSTREHLNILSKLSFLLRNPLFVDFLKSFPDADSFFLKIEEFEAQMKDKR